MKTRTRVLTGTALAVALGAGAFGAVSASATPAAETAQVSVAGKKDGPSGKNSPRRRT